MTTEREKEFSKAHYGWTSGKEDRRKNQNHSDYEDQVADTTAEIVLNLIRKADQLKCNRTKFCKDVANNLIGLALYLNIDEELVLPGESEKNKELN